ncbi:DUF1127 domain-containing protein [Halomonas sp. HP20-15]|uniref:DUF1127 domain-containing protein n=1 Tax=Halomonas sp. HP20-15 TaxID=3085901 RepID=UPI002982471D|nr:DUF1127 domain-containing protein [Halomonas sp. HP20-15]MDW5377732.1 DUF1127 domain-containing protein [Halomonas sp. HP20-15]
MSSTPLHRLVATLRLYRHRHLTRQRLRELDPHLLADVGITLTEARREGSKRFWEA